MSYQFNPFEMANVRKLHCEYLFHRILTSTMQHASLYNNAGPLGMI